MKPFEPPSLPKFYFKVSSEPFDFDVAAYPFRHVHRTAKSVFMSNDERITVSDENGVVELRIGTPSLSHACIIWDETLSKLEVTLDAFGIQSVFYHDAGKSVYLSNRVDTLARTLSAPDLCDFALSFYLVAGFLPAGRTFWKKIRRVAVRSEWELASRKSKHETNTRWQPVRQKQAFSPGEVIDSLKSSLERIRTEVAPTQMRLSGGADTRIVSFLWGSPIEAVTVRSPWMDPGSDLDVNLAKAWAEMRGLSHRELTPDFKNFAFFGEPPGRPMLTGLCGGEFLGGQFEHVIPSSPEKWRNTLKNDFTPEFREVLEEDTWFQDVSADNELWLAECARVFVQSTRSTIYDSIAGSWSEPCELQLSTVSPFVAEPFLDIFLRALGTWGDYEFYERVFRHLGPEVTRVPLSSQLTLRAPDLAADSKWGHEPKAMRTKSPGALKNAPTESEQISRWASILMKNGVALSEIGIQKMLTSSSSRVNARSLFTWVMARLAKPVTSA